ncbi:hypothetical protein CPC08DRAFT_822792 [Agrocybe pediades]|nr:hypothetical protein CPC08DRAFT_822792 [Agrocybe pediades]
MSAPKLPKNFLSSAFLVALYAGVFTAVLRSNSLPEIPEQKEGLDLNEAYFNLHQIASQPHPVNSYANDIVRKYILDYLRNETAGYQHVEVVDDLTSNITWVANSGHGVSFEGSNILVKVAGTEPEYREKGAVLFSAHFDSVPTGPGVTDDGMGVVTLMELVRYLATHRTKRTAVFNINNGEEDGLKGAFAFLRHPWSKITDTFFNLEGAAAGGRPILFRSTSMAPVLSFKEEGVLHPHGNVLSADAFSRRVIKSRTDYTVYEYGLGDGSGMEGIDFAFYQGRSSYHTKYDSIPGAKGGKRALWAMMETTRAAGVSMLNREEDDHDRGRPADAAVYFDVFGKFFFVFTQRSLFNFNAALLIVGPVILLVLHRAPECMFKSASRGHSCVQLACIWRCLKFWVAFVAAGVAQALLICGYLSFNPFIIHSSPFVVLVSHLSLAYLSFKAALSFLSMDIDTNTTANQHGPSRQTLLIQTYNLSWLLLALGNIALDRLKVGGVYFLTGWNLCLLGSCAFVCVERIVERKKSSSSSWIAGSSAGSAAASRATSDDDDEVADSVTKKTPLLDVPPPKQHVDQGAPQGWWWILQASLAIPGPLVLISHVLLLLLQSLSQTLSDGSQPLVVYAATSLLSTFLILPITPFITTKMHHFITLLILLVCISTTAWSWSAFPFAQDAPLKVFYQQRVQVGLSAHTNEVIKNVGTLTGATRYLESEVVSALPSSWSSKNSNVTCVPSSTAATLSTCEWSLPANLLPSPGGSVSALKDSKVPMWISAEVSRTSRTSARITLKGTNTRSCRLYFDSRPVKTYKVQVPEEKELDHADSDNAHPGFPIPEAGLRVIQLWGRTWGRKFVVDVTWGEDDGDGDDHAQPEASSKLSGRVACEWGEYESGMIGLGLDSQLVTGKIPAYEEILSFLPLWAAASKVADGLVEVYALFEV